MYFISVLAVMSILGFATTLNNQIGYLHSGDLDVFNMVLNSLDLITITVPPALPTCLQIGISLALDR